jgi:hypothetical protein
MIALAERPCLNCAGRVIPPNGRSPAIELQYPDDIPVEVTAVEADSTLDGTARGSSYRVRNNSASGLVTLVTAFTFEGAEGERSRITIMSEADSWHRDAAFVDAGSEQWITAAFAIRGRSPGRLTVRPLYAEFDDGRRLGPMADTYAKCLRIAREKLLRDYANLVQVYERGGVRSLDRALQGDSIAVAWLGLLKAESGIDSVTEQLTRVRRLQP